MTARKPEVLFPEVRKRLSRWQDELPSLIQPERSHVQNIEDLSALLQALDEAMSALEKLEHFKLVKPVTLEKNQELTYSVNIIPDALNRIRELSEGK